MSATALKSKKTVIFKPKPSKQRSKILSGDGDGGKKIKRRRRHRLKKLF
jgi:hypothetical protein